MTSGSGPSNGGAGEHSFDALAGPPRSRAPARVSRATW
jgi:hypothetical protein